MPNKFDPTGRKRMTLAGLLLLLTSFGTVRAALDISISRNVRTCSTMTVSWDVRRGSAPWTLLIAPVNSQPVSVTIPASYMPTSASTWSYNWTLPDYPRSPQLIAAVSDSSGRYAGVSDLSSISSGSGSCAAPVEDLDFVWWGPTASPRSCGSWLIEWEEERGNNGIVDPVQITVLPEQGTPVTYEARRGDTSWRMPVDWIPGTRLVIAAFDAGRSGTGGVGDVYTVGAAASTCATNSAAPAEGLVPATTTASAPSRTSTTGRPTSTSRNGNSTTTSTSGNGTVVPGGSDATSNESSHHKTSIGATIGAAAAAGAISFAIILGLLFWWYRRRQAKTGGGQSGKDGGGWPEVNVVPWKWEVVEDDEKAGSKGVGGREHLDEGDATTLHIGPASPSPPQSSFRVMGARSPRPSQDPHLPANKVSASSALGPTHVSNPSLTSRNIFAVVPDNSLVPAPAGPSSQQGHQVGVSSGSMRQTTGQPITLPKPALGKVVPDEMLFPPPPVRAAMMQSPGPGGSGGEGGIAGYPTMALPNRSGEGGPRVAPPRRKPSDPRAKAAAAAAAAAAGAPRGPGVPDPSYSRNVAGYERAGETAYHPPPSEISTSIHDPYSHMSQIYSDEQKSTLAAASSGGNNNGGDQGGGGGGRKTHGRGSSFSARLPAAIHPGARGRADTFKDDGEDQGSRDGGLPYL